MAERRQGAERGMEIALPPPPRFQRPKLIHIVFVLAALLLTGHAFYGTELATMSMGELLEMAGNTGRLLGEMFPPALSTLPKIWPAVIQTLQMSLVGTMLGVVLSLPLGFFAAKNLAPLPVLYFLSRGFLSLCRTIPDMVWAIFFVIIVGLGPLAGMLTLLVDTLGFAGRFFAEAFEEAEAEPHEALASIGATVSGSFFSVTLPSAMPSCINTALFSLERAVQSSVVLGLVGAGGIGMLLEEPMTWHQYQQATTVILTIFILLVVVEQFSALLRKHVLS